jgi:MFS family permease
MDKISMPTSETIEDVLHPVVEDALKQGDDASVDGPINIPSLTEHDKKIMKRLRWKVDVWILPMLSAVFFLASLDRSDVSNLQVAGMQEAVHASDTEWAQVVSLFYIGYILSQPFGTLALRRLTPPITIGGATILWGILTLCLMFVKTWNQAVAVRVFLGAGEGIVHAASLYLSFWYGPGELTSRAAIYFSTWTLAGAFNGLVSSAIERNMSNDRVFTPWQWILLVEGVITIGIGVIVLIALPPVPERVRWGFSADEKRLAVIRTRSANNTPNATFRWHQVSKTLASPPLYTYAIIFSANQIALNAQSSFLPAIVKGMGYSGSQAQLMTVPIFACAFVTVLAGGFISDRIRRHGYCIAFCSTISIVGYVMLIASPKNNTVRYIGACIAAAGQYPITNMVLAWLAFNTRAYTDRATASTLVPMVGQAASLAGLQGFNTPPYYIKGNSVVLAIVCLIPPASIFTSWYYHRLNQRKADMQSTETATSTLPVGSFEELGGDHPDFKYSL